jgi:hypothetical protein
MVSKDLNETKDSETPNGGRDCLRVGISRSRKAERKGL